MVSPQVATGVESSRSTDSAFVRARNGHGFSSVQAVQTLSAVSIGTQAVRALGASRRGRVAAVFNRSLYLEFDGGWCCLVGTELGAGPVNICVWLPGKLDIVTRNAPVDVVDQGFFIRNWLHVATASARVWTAPIVEWSGETLIRGLAALDPLCVDHAPSTGLSRIVWPRSSADPASFELCVAIPVVASLVGWLQRMLEHNTPNLPPGSITKLVGLGPGLTPSGDDFLVGMLAVLSLAGRFDLVAAVDQVIRPTLEEGTGPISRLHLAAALDGESSERLHLMVNALLTGDHGLLASRLVLISQVGHSSGWDSLAGAVMVLRVLARTNRSVMAVGRDAS
jgi:hypothetical protein